MIRKGDVFTRNLVGYIDLEVCGAVLNSPCNYSQKPTSSEIHYLHQREWAGESE